MLGVHSGFEGHWAEVLHRTGLRTPQFITRVPEPPSSLLLVQLFVQHRHFAF